MQPIRRVPFYTAARESQRGGAIASDEYRRAARRLRGRLRGNPAALQRSLKRLSDRADERARAGEDETAGGPPAEFAREVARALDGPVLRYSSRLELLRIARRLGIGQFEANLIIALVQHEKAVDVPVFRRHEKTTDVPVFRWVGVAGIVLMIESILILGGWLLLGSI